MRVGPLWRLVHQCAIQLTEQGNTPFTRADLVACVRKTVPDAKENSLNPVIQGIADNLKGGAPGADGRKLLHSVGRGQFVLLTMHKQSTEPRSLKLNETTSSYGVKPQYSARENILPEKESVFRDAILILLRKHFRNAECVLEPEGRVSYRVPSGEEFKHASDILITGKASAKQVSIEIKFRSAVTDQFKCRAYDATHMKQQHGDRLLTVMLYAKTDSGISIERARSICYCFDRFYGGPAQQFLESNGLATMATDIDQFLFWKP